MSTLKHQLPIFCCGSAIFLAYCDKFSAVFLRTSRGVLAKVGNKHQHFGKATLVETATHGHVLLLT